MKTLCKYAPEEDGASRSSGFAPASNELASEDCHVTRSFYIAQQIVCSKKGEKAGLCSITISLNE